MINIITVSSSAMSADLLTRLNDQTNSQAGLFWVYESLTSYTKMKAKICKVLMTVLQFTT